MFSPQFVLQSLSLVEQNFSKCYGWISIKVCGGEPWPNDEMRGNLLGYACQFFWFFSILCSHVRKRRETLNEAHPHLLYNFATIVEYSLSMQKNIGTDARIHCFPLPFMATQGSTFGWQRYVLY